MRAAGIGLGIAATALAALAGAAALFWAAVAVADEAGGVRWE